MNASGYARSFSGTDALASASVPPPGTMSVTLRKVMLRGRRTPAPPFAGTPVMDDAMRPSAEPVTFSMRMLRRYVFTLLPFGSWRWWCRMKMGVM